VADSAYASLESSSIVAEALALVRKVLWAQESFSAVDRG